MKSEKINIQGIPTIIWGKPSNNVYLYVHGKDCCKELAESFAEIAEAKGYQTISFDLPKHGERKNENYDCDVWNGIKDLNNIGSYVFNKWQKVSLFACSLGAFFSLNAYKDKNFEKCLFQSPILNMEHLIKDMLVWFNVTEEELEMKKKVPTPIDTLSWDYYQYVKKNPTNKWNFPTSILYARKDNLQPIEVINKFVNDNGCTLTISENSEHPFMADSDKEIVLKWMNANI